MMRTTFINSHYMKYFINLTIQLLMNCRNISFFFIEMMAEKVEGRGLENVQYLCGFDG